MLFRSFGGGAVEGACLQLTPTLDIYFGVHGAIAVLVMSLEVAVLAVGVSMLKRKARNAWNGRLTKILFGFWWFAFLSGEIFYIIMYVCKKNKNSTLDQHWPLNFIWLPVTAKYCKLQFR